MRRPRFVRPLSESETQEIEHIFRHGPNSRVRRRAQTLRLSIMGYTVAEIARIIGCNRQSIRNWFNAFEDGGPMALLDKPKSGRPPIATIGYRKDLVEAIKTNPHDLGYPFTVWTITRIRAHMARKTHNLLSESRVRQIMKEEGLVFKKPKHTLKGKRDKDAFAAVRDLLEAAKKSPWNPIPV